MNKTLIKTLIIAIIIIICLPANRQANAVTETNYYRVINEESALYESSTKQNILFYLPYTYYVDVLGETGELYHVRIYGDDNTPAIMGYTEKTNLYQDDLEVSSPYPNATVKTCSSTVLYNDVTFLTKQMYLFPERTYTLYGKNFDTAGNIVYLIGNGERIGYVKESSLYPFEIPYHQNPLTFLETPSNDDSVSAGNIDEENKGIATNSVNEYTMLKVGIFCCLICAGCIGLYVALRKKDAKPNVTNYYDENDYE